MRRFLTGMVLAIVVCSGCKNGMRPNNQGMGGNMPVPTAEQLVNHLNQQARGIQEIQSEGTIALKSGIASINGKGLLVYEKPRNFRFIGDVAGKSVADVGSNDKEFWFWFKDQEGLAYCSHEDLPKVRLSSLQLNPEWIVDALCVNEYGPPQNYQVRQAGQNVELILNTTTPQGDPVQKITIVANAGPNRGRIVGHRLRDARGHDIFAADVNSYQQVDGFVIPRSVTMRQAGQKGEVSFTLENARVNHNNVGEKTFLRPSYGNEINLARSNSSPLGVPQSFDKIRASGRQ